MSKASKKVTTKKTTETKTEAKKGVTGSAGKLNAINIQYAGKKDSILREGSDTLNNVCRIIKYEGAIRFVYHNERDPQKSYLSDPITEKEANKMYDEHILKGVND